MSEAQLREKIFKEEYVKLIHSCKNEVLQAYKIHVWVSPNHRRAAGCVDCIDSYSPVPVAFAQLCIGRITSAYFEGHQKKQSQGSS